MKTRYLLGIDVGTSGTKTALFCEDLSLSASAVFEYPLYEPHVQWAEQNPEDWWAAAKKGIASVLVKSGIAPCDIAGIGLTGQMHGLVLLDKNNQVLRPAIIWCDQRTAPECAEITKKIGKLRLLELTANPALTGFTASKLMWVKNHEPQTYEKIAHVLLPKDYIRFKLTGEYATDVSDASGMQLLDVANRRWSAEIMDKLGLDKSLFAKVYESPGLSGLVNKIGASETGLAEGIPVAGGAGDQAAAAIGCGIVREGMISDTIGSSGVVFAQTDSPLMDKEGRVHTFCHAVPGKWHVMGVTQAAGLSLKWFKDNFCFEEKQQAEMTRKNVYDIMLKEAESVPVGCEGLIFLPYLMGERSPILNPSARGVFFGLTNAHGKAHMIRSVLEGVIFSQNDCLKIIKSLGVNASEIRMCGGGAQNAYFRQMFSDCFNSKVVTMQNTEGGVLGAAILAGVCANVFKDVQSACAERLVKGTEQHPCGINYEPYYEKYNKLYEAVKDLY